MNKRILFSNNGTISDWTMALNNYNGASKTIDFVSGQDALLIGSKLPFNSLYFKLKEPNIISSEIGVEYYSNGWNQAVEITDETNGFTQSGHITFVPSKNSTWSMKPDSTEIAELSTTIIYDQYWLKLTFGTTIAATTAIQWVGSLFSNDDDLAAEFPDLIKSDVLYSYKANKTDWEEQHVKAAEIIEHDLINKGIIDGSENILARDWYRNAAIQKTAEIIFSAFGDDYADQRLRAREEYVLRLVKRLPRVDKNNNAKEDVAETRYVSGFLSR